LRQHCFSASAGLLAVPMVPVLPMVLMVAKVPMVPMVLMVAKVLMVPVFHASSLLGRSPHRAAQVASSVLPVVVLPGLLSLKA
jgi:hypothetical protein